MFLRFLILTILNSLTMINQVHAHEFVPKNNLKIPTTFVKPCQTMTESTFNRNIGDVEKNYKPLIAAKGQELVINRLWQDSEVNAGASRSEGRPIINEVFMYGGLARHPAITEDAFAIVVCHELGHLVGGAPLVSTVWGKASNDGQADYFAVTKCVRKYFETKANNEQIASSKKMPVVVQSKCLLAWGKTKEYSICVRTAQATFALANFFAAMERSITSVTFETPSKKVVTSTFNGHPDAQCRLDTYFQGSLCQVSHKVEFSNIDANKGACINYNQDGSRPKCWFKPGQSTASTSGGFQNRRN